MKVPGWLATVPRVRESGTAVVRPCGRGLGGNALMGRRPPGKRILAALGLARVTRITKKAPGGKTSLATTPNGGKRQI